MIRLLKPRRARLWVWWADSPVKIALGPGESARAFFQSRTEEGFSSEGRFWTFDGAEVREEVTLAGRDCDGRIEQRADYACPVGHLAARRVHCDPLGPEMFWHAGRPIRWPAWKETSNETTDEAAQAANY